MMTLHGGASHKCQKCMFKFFMVLIQKVVACDADAHGKQRPILLGLMQKSKHIVVYKLLALPQCALTFVTTDSLFFFAAFLLTSWTV